MELLPRHFADFFQAVHGYDPYPWQQVLVDRLVDSDSWPEVLDLPTGSGKTAALDAAVFHLAMRSNTPDKAAIRIALVVDRRLVVDDAHGRAEKISRALDHSLKEETGGCDILREVARRLNALAGRKGRPLAVQRLRGGAPLENDWARTPSQPTILCSTVDQVGSRLLFRGYGISDRMKPVHAGLLGTGSLILLDEAHLAEPFRQTIDSIRRIGRADIQVSLLSATPGFKAIQPFGLSPADRDDISLKKRLETPKPIRLMLPIHDDPKAAANAFATEAIQMAERLQEQGVVPVAVGIVVNRVALARDIFTTLSEKSSIDPVLMTGRSRNVDRDELVRKLAPFRTDEDARVKAESLFVVATQCLEVGVDLDLDGLVTQAASLDALRQRFGRLNRGGRPIGALGAILAYSTDLSRKTEDPVYGDRISRTWQALQDIAQCKDKDKVVDFGVAALPKRLEDAGIDIDRLSSERPDAPVIMPAYLDLWSQTSPKPEAEPEIGLFLHGAYRTTAGVSIIWRSDISSDDLTHERDNVREVIRLVPPRAAEAIEIPLWTARAWLRGSIGDGNGRSGTDLSDAPETGKPENLSAETPAKSKKAFRWAGYDDPATRFVDPNELRTGDLLIVPAEYGGCDKFGWKPESDIPVTDVADRASEPYWGQRCAVRVARDVVRKQDQWNQWNRIASVLADHAKDNDLVQRLLTALPSEDSDGHADSDPVPRDIREPLKALRFARGRIEVRYPYAGGVEGGAVLVAERGFENRTGPAEVPTTEDDAASHSLSKPVHLDEHGHRVRCYAMEFAGILGLGDVKDDLGLAALLHDAGKADPRFQTMLAGGDPWNRPAGLPMAKSGRSWSSRAWIRSGLPRGWRHEALSVRMALKHPQLSAAHDPILVLWLIGTHHGYGRPFFDFHDANPDQPLPCLDVGEWQLPADRAGPQSLAFDLDGADWPSLFESLKRRYGIWGLAHLEAVLRLADHRASEEERAS